MMACVGKDDERQQVVDKKKSKLMELKTLSDSQLFPSAPCV
jgi:hypothetical protein